MAVTDLPLAKGSDHVQTLESLGWRCRRSKKNHFILTHPGHPQVHLSIPDHKEVDRRTLRSQVRLIGLTDQQYLEAFNQRKKA